jgi:hypothetical protein
MTTAQKTHQNELLEQCRKMTRNDISQWLTLLHEAGDTYAALVVWGHLESLNN